MKTTSSLFSQTQHSPSFWELNKIAKHEGTTLKDFCIPVNSYFPNPNMMNEILKGVEFSLKYYPSQQPTLLKDLSAFVDVPEKNLVLGNGSTELITWIDHLFVKESIAVPIPTFGRWTDQPAVTGKKIVLFQRLEKEGFHLNIQSFVDHINKTGAKSAVVCNPNNPTGALLTIKEVEDFLEHLRHLDLVVVDESFIDYAVEGEIPTAATLIDRFPNLIVLKSLGKNLGLHGTRMGYAVASETRTKILRKHLPPWNINGVSQKILNMLPKYRQEYLGSLAKNIKDREFAFEAFSRIPGLKVFPSKGNFHYVKVPDYVDGTSVRNSLLSNYGFFVRECGNKLGSSKQFIRIAIRPQMESQMLAIALKDTIATLASETQWKPCQEA